MTKSGIGGCECLHLFIRSSIAGSKIEHNILFSFFLTEFITDLLRNNPSLQTSEHFRSHFLPFPRHRYAISKILLDLGNIRWKLPSRLD